MTQILYNQLPINCQSRYFRINKCAVRVYFHHVDLHTVKMHVMSCVSALFVLHKIEMDNHKDVNRSYYWLRAYEFAEMF